MDDNEKFVREHWERAEACPSLVKPQCCISLGGRGFTRKTVPDTISGYAPNEKAAWAAARAFTEERLEQIRQVNREIELLASYGKQYTRESLASVVAEHDADGRECEEERFENWLKRLPFYVRENCTMERVRAREQEALADLQRGMKTLTKP